MRSTGHGVGGMESFGRAVDGQAPAVAGVRIPLERLILRDHMDRYELLVGMETLRGSVFAISHDQERPVHWLVDAADGP